MARKKPTPPTDQNGSVEPPKVSTKQIAAAKAARAVVQVPLEGARCLVTIEADGSEWEEEPDFRLDPLPPGAIVRLRPPATATDGAIDRLRALFEQAGAARVTVLPRPRADVLPEAVASSVPEKAVGAREAVLGLVEESNAKDKAVLRDLAERVMAEVGI